MATLDDKILDGPSVGYCSSDDEGDGDGLGMTNEGNGKKIFKIKNNYNYFWAKLGRPHLPAKCQGQGLRECWRIMNDLRGRKKCGRLLRKRR